MYFIFWYVAGNNYGYDIRWWSEFYNLIHGANSKVKTSSPKMYPNHKNDVRLEFLAFSPFQRYLTFPDWTTSSKDKVFESWAPPLFSQNFQKINPPYLGNWSSDHWRISDLRFGGWNQHVCQISLNSERVEFSSLGDLLTWNDIMVNLPYNNEYVKKFSTQIFTTVMGNRGDKRLPTFLIFSFRARFGLGYLTNLLLFCNKIF